MTRWAGVILILILSGCMHPNVPWLNTLQQTKAEPQLRERFGPPLYRQEVLEGEQKGAYTLVFKDTQRIGVLGGTCMLWFLQFDSDHILRGRSALTC